MIALDTTFLIDLDRDPGLAATAKAWATAGRVIVPAQAAIEYAAGKRQPHVAVAALSAAFDVCDVDRDTMELAAELARDAMAAGGFPGWPDIQIAATALVHGAKVATRNGRHFQALGVPVEGY